MSVLVELELDLVFFPYKVLTLSFLSVLVHEFELEDGDLGFYCFDFEHEAGYLALKN